MNVTEELMARLRVEVAAGRASQVELLEALEREHRLAREWFEQYGALLKSQDDVGR